MRKAVFSLYDCVVPSVDFPCHQFFLYEPFGLKFTKMTVIISSRVTKYPKINKAISEVVGVRASTC